MTDIVPVPNWGGVRQLETNEYATGGLNGNMNEQAKSLAGQNMYSRLYAGLPFDPVFTSQAGGFPIGGKAALTNGDIVRSTEPNNTIDPNVDMTGWVSVDRNLKFAKSINDLRSLRVEDRQVAYVQSYYENQGMGGGYFVFDESSVLPNNDYSVIAPTVGSGRWLGFGSFSKPERCGAKCDGVTDDSDIFIKMRDAGIKHFKLTNGSTYGVASVRFNGRTGIKIDGNGAILKKVANGNHVMIELDDYSSIKDVGFDGNYSQFPTLSWGSNLMIRGDYCTANNIKSHHATHHGIYVYDCVGSTVKNSQCYSNGLNRYPDGTWQSDGIALLNTIACSVRDSQTWDNGRSGTTQTTYGESGGVEVPSLDLGADNVFDNVKAWDNVYNDINVEQITRPKILNCVAKGTILFGRSPDTKINLTTAAKYYADIIDGLTIQNCNSVINSGTVNALEIGSGANVKIDGFDVKIDSAVSVSGQNVININVTSGFNIIKDSTVNRAQTGFNLNGEFSEISNIRCLSATNLKYVLNGFTSNNDGEINILSNIKMFKRTNISKPNAGLWNIGDRCLNIGTDQTFAEYTCSQSGRATSNSWVASTSFSAGSYLYSGNNVYRVKTAGVSGTVAPTSTVAGDIPDGTVVLTYQTTRALFRSVASFLNAMTIGSTANRPSSDVVVGQPYYDTTISKQLYVKTINPVTWVNSIGDPVP